MKRICSLVLIVTLLLSGCSFFKSDEQLMKDKINSFVTSYNSGDVEGMIDTLDSQSRQIAKSTLELSDTLISSLTGISVSVKDVFALCISFSDDFDTLTIVSFDDFQVGESTATVSVTVAGEKSGTEETEQAEFKMKKENGDWYINDFYGIGGL